MSKTMFVFSILNLSGRESLEIAVTNRFGFALRVYTVIDGRLCHIECEKNQKYGTRRSRVT